MTPAVSILLPLQGTDFLEPAMKSLLTQSFDDFELVIMDDAPYDLTDEIRSLSRDDPRVRVHKNETDKGLASVLNAGLQHCTAPLIARADGDDLYHPDRLALQVAEMSRRPNLLALSTGWHRIDENGQKLHTNRPATGPAKLRLRAMFGAPLLHPGAMIRACALREVGGYDPKLWTAQDSDLWNRLAARGDIDNLTAPLVSWRRHGNSVSSRRGEAGEQVSRQVVARHVSAYLDRDVTAAGITSALNVWRSEARGDDSLFREIVDQAKAREKPEVARDFRHAVALSYRRIFTKYGDVQSAIAALRWYLA